MEMDRNRLIEQIVGGLAIAIAMAAVLAIWSHLSGAVIQVLRDELPSGAVVAYDTPDGCPEGWSVLQEASDRFIVGAGGQYKYRGTGGRDSVTLEILHMPNHFHHNPTEGGKPKGREPALRAQDYGFLPSDNMPHERPTASVGGGQPHENMPPYLALFLCRKE